jgi:branched-subunit amino acid transport protein
MDYRSPETNVLLRITTTFTISVERAIDRFLSFLPTASKILKALIIPAIFALDGTEDIAIQ